MTMKGGKKFIFSGTRGWPVFQYLAAFTGLLNVICSGMFYAWPSPSLPKLLQSDSYISITKDEGSWIAVMLLLGEICGAALGAIILNKFGRKSIILLTSGPYFIAWIMKAYAQSVEMLFLARFIAGTSDGLIFPACCMYFGEIANPNIRGFIGCSMTVACIFGMLLINIIGSSLSIKTTALVSSALPVLLLLTFSWMPESPYYLIMNGKFEHGRRSLQIFKGSDDVEQELNRLTQAIAEQNSNSGKYLNLFTVKSNRRAVFIVMGTRGAQILSGAMSFVFYVQMIFAEAGDNVSPTVASMIYFSAQVIISAFSTIIVDKTGRRPLMIISLIGVILALLLEGCYFCIKNTTDIDTDTFTFISIIALIVFVIMYSIGMQSIPLLLTGEVFPANVKPFAMIYASFYFGVVTTIVSKFFQYTKDEFGLHVPFFVFAVCGVLGLLFIMFYVPETKGKTLEEIQQELKGD